MNAILLIIPVVGAIGVLLGVDAYRQANGQKPLYSEQATNGDGGNDHHENTLDIGITNIQYCNISYGIIVR